MAVNWDEEILNIDSDDYNDVENDVEDNNDDLSLSFHSSSSLNLSLDKSLEVDNIYDNYDDQDSPPLQDHQVVSSRTTAKEYERLLISKYDARTIDNRRAMWFLVDSNWIEKWGSYVTNNSPPSTSPGQVHNQSLYKGDGVSLRDDIEAVSDYRGVNPMVWFLYAELYGVGDVAEICRYTVDHRGEVPPLVSREEVIRSCKLKAKIEVSSMRRRFSTPERSSRSERKGRQNNADDTTRQEGEELFCGCFSETAITVICHAFVSCFTCNWRTRNDNTNNNMVQMKRMGML
ncbi:hypothetical protein ScalyP_jg9762 [Parmales sp. scaly parma]|nr:hypothetical protein ScalyP_jg9762 [Parmales sp. scaly parma]